MDTYISNAREQQAVYWNDPDDGICSGQFVIQQIDSESGRIESPLTLVLLTNEEGSELQALAQELAPPLDQVV